MDQMLWIGCLESDEEFIIKAGKGSDLASAQVSQKNLVTGLEQLSGAVFDSINGSVLPPFPVYKERIIEPVVWSHSNGSFDISVGYKNDKYINRVNCKSAMRKAAVKWCSERYKGGGLTVFVYSMRSAPMAAACEIKKRIPNAKIYLIVTDLPQFMDLGQSKVKAFLKSLDWKFIKKMQKQFDGFILYATKMAEFLKIPDGRWLLIEGSYDKAEEIAVDEAEKKNAVMYSGTLDEQYGIKMLVDAFMQLEDSDTELWLTGGGNSEEYIKLCAKNDARIKFFGFLPSRKDVLIKQQQSSLLVNMRLPSEKASDYCFPSKLFEYMATGVPVLSFRIGGIPEEYYPYLYIINDESTASVAARIKEIMKSEKTDREALGQQAKAFILREKTLKMQCSKIIEFIRKQQANDE